MNENYGPAVISVLENKPKFDGPCPDNARWSVKWSTLRGTLQGTSLLNKAIALVRAHQYTWAGPGKFITEEALYTRVVMDLISEIATENIKAYPVGSENVVVPNDPLAMIQRLSRQHDVNDRTRVSVRQELDSRSSVSF